MPWAPSPPRSCLGVGDRRQAFFLTLNTETVPVLKGKRKEGGAGTGRMAWERQGPGRVVSWILVHRRPSMKSPLAIPTTGLG